MRNVLAMLFSLVLFPILTIQGMVAQDEPPDQLVALTDG